MIKIDKLLKKIIKKQLFLLNSLKYHTTFYWLKFRRIFDYFFVNFYKMINASSFNKTKQRSVPFYYSDLSLVKIDKVINKINKHFANYQVSSYQKLPKIKIFMSGWSNDKSIEFLESSGLTYKRTYRKDVSAENVLQKYGFFSIFKVSEIDENISIIVSKFLETPNSLFLPQFNQNSTLYIDSISFKFYGIRSHVFRSFMNLVNLHLNYFKVFELISPEILSKLFHYFHMVIFDSLLTDCSKFFKPFQIKMLLGLEPLLINLFQVEIFEDLNCTHCNYSYELTFSKFFVDNSKLSLYSSQKSLTYSNVNILPNGMIFDRYQFLLNDVRHLNFQSFISGWWQDFTTNSCTKELFLSRQFTKSIDLEKAIIFVGRNSNNWYHFVTEYLVNLQSLADIDPTYPIVINHKFDKQVSKFIEQNSNRSIFYQDSLTTLNVRSAICFSLRSHVNDVPQSAQCLVDFNLDSSDLKEIRTRLLSNLTTHEPVQYTLISRHGVSNRNVRNFKSLVNLLLKYNFNLFDPSKTSIENQVEIVYRSKVIIFEPGSGAINIMFMHPSSVAIYLEPNNASEFLVYDSLAKIFNIKFITISSKYSKSFLNKSLLQIINSDYIVDLKELNKIILENFGTLPKQ
jgi:capsular polysaccharide biosynthesis protein